MDLGESPDPLDLGIVGQVCQKIQEYFGITCFGIDILKETKSNNYYIVDLNYLPSYKNIPNIHL